MTRVTKTQLVAAITAYEACGHTVTALRLHPGGAIDLLTEPLPATSPADGSDDWVALAGIPDSTGAG